jgi:hypothetical protein
VDGEARAATPQPLFAGPAIGGWHRAFSGKFYRIIESAYVDI